MCLFCSHLDIRMMVELAQISKLSFFFTLMKYGGLFQGQITEHLVFRN